MNVFEDVYSDEKLSNTEMQLIHLFRFCDRSDKGYIVKEELEELCLSLGISNEDCDTLFRDLDADDDGRISFRDFSAGFKEFLDPEEESPFVKGNQRRRTSMWSVRPELSPRQDKEWKKAEAEKDTNEKAETLQDESERRRKESVFLVWTTFTSSLVDSNLLSLSPESQTQIRQLYKELQQKTIPPTVVTKVECAVTSLMKEMEKLQKQNRDLEELYERERSTHVKTLKSLEVEMEDQVSKMEERAKAKARLEQEEEKRQLREQMDQEVAEMQAHLKIFQKVDSWLKNSHGKDEDKVQEVRKKLEESCNTNRELQCSLHETTASLALLRSDLAHSRLQYEEKCKELHHEREQVLEYMHQYDHLRRQLDLIHDANKRLQDTNDSLRESFETEWRYGGFASRSSSTRSVRRNLNRSPSTSSVTLPRKESDTSSQFGMRRLLEDLDSGFSTLPDRTDEGHVVGGGNYLSVNGPSSLEEELKNLPETNSSGEVSLFHPSSKASQSLIESSQRSSSASSPSPRKHYVFQPPSQSLPLIRNPERNLMENYYDYWSDPGTLGPPDRSYKVVLAGDAAVGKSTFVARVCQRIFLPDTASTLGVDYKVKSIAIDGKHIVLQLWDTAGQERFRSITKSYFRRADGVMLLYDVTNERSFTNVRQWIQNIDEACETRLPVALCGNKVDLREESMKNGITVVTTSAGERLAKEYNSPFFETSTKTGEGVLAAVVDLGRKMGASEDLAVQTSALRVIAGSDKKKCCFMS